MPALKKYFFIWLVIVGAANQSHAQTAKVDSLLLALKNTKHDTIKLNVLFDLVESISDDKVWSKYNEQASELAEKLSRSENEIINKRGKKGLADALNNKGFLIQNQGDVTLALEYFNRCLKIQKEIGDKKGIAFSLINIGNIYQNKGDIKKAENYFIGSLKIQESMGDKKGAAFSLISLGFIYFNRGDITKALDYYNRSLKIQEEFGDKQSMYSSLNNIGLIYQNQGDITKALDYYGRSLQIAEDIGYKKGIALALNNIGVIYKEQGDVTKALVYYNKALKIREVLGDKQGIAGSLTNIGLIYNSQNEIFKALDCFGRSLKILEEVDDQKGIAWSLANIAGINNRQNQFARALNNYSRSLKIYEDIGDKQGVATSLNQIGGMYFRLASEEKTPAGRANKYSLALSHCNNSLLLSKQLGYPGNIRNAERLASKIDSSRGNYAGAFEHFKQFIFYRDSLSNSDTRKASIKSQLKYEYEKKEAVLQEQREKEQAVAEEKNRRQQIIIWSVAFGLSLVIVFAIFVFRSLKTTRRQKIIIEEKQKDILDSIHYAKRIQQSLLPSESYIAKNLKRLLKN